MIITLDRYYKKCTSVSCSDIRIIKTLGRSNYCYTLSNNKVHISNMKLFIDFVERYNESHEDKIQIRSNFKIE